MRLTRRRVVPPSRAFTLAVAVAPRTQRPAVPFEILEVHVLKPGGLGAVVAQAHRHGGVRVAVAEPPGRARGGGEARRA
jgi:hypothetical protein